MVPSDHFSVDGTLFEAWASHKSFQPKDGPPSSVPPGRNAEVSFHGQRRSNQHACLDDRPRSVHGPQVQRDRREALLCGASVDGAPQCAVGGYRVERSDRLRRARHLARDALAGSHRHDGDEPSPATRPTTPASSSPMYVSSASRRILRRTRPGNGPRSMGAPPATKDIGRVNESANGSRNHSGGSRPSPGVASSVTSARTATEPGSS